MRRQIVTTKWASTLIPVLVLCLCQGVTWPQSVVINGVPLVTTRTPVNMAGSILLPMRDVFEALNSEIEWFASERKIMATRGNTVIQLWLDQRNATINGQPVTLAVAPTLIGGSTYVPLRFPAEAFGGDVKWDAATRTAQITIPPIGEPPPGPVEPPQPPQPPQPPTPPTPPAPVVVEGTLVQVISAPASIVIAVSGTGLAQAITLTTTTTFTRHAEGQPPAPARITDAVPGDYARATLGPDGLALAVDFTYGEAGGNVAGISQGSILLKDNTVFSISPTVSVLDQTGKALALSDVPPNAEVMLRYQPVSRAVWEIRVKMPQTPPPPPENVPQPEIIVLGILNDSPLLRGGDVLRLQLQGTPGGTADVAVGRLFRELPMSEVRPGIYQAQYVVPEGTNYKNVAIAGNLTIGGVKARPFSSPVRLTIDSIPPDIPQVSPQEGDTVNTTSAMIEADFDALGGTPINPASAGLWINGVPVRRDLHVTPDQLNYLAEDLDQGRVRVEVAVEDLAGNRANRAWTFNVGAANPIITAAWHDAPGALLAGNTLVVNMRVVQPGGQAGFDIGTLRTNLPMAQLANTNLYRGRYIVRAGDRLENGLVTVHYRDPQGRTANMEITNRLDINTALPTELSITAPAANSRVADTIVISGQAPPGAQVRVTITYRVRVVGVVTGQLWQGVVVADAAGLWMTPDISSNTGLLGRADEYIVTAQQLDAAAHVLSQRQITLVK